jgi:hypothetical protein
LQFAIDTWQLNKYQSLIGSDDDADSADSEGVDGISNSENGDIDDVNKGKKRFRIRSRR